MGEVFIRNSEIAYEIQANPLGVLNYLLVTLNEVADLSGLVVESK